MTLRRLIDQRRGEHIHVTSITNIYKLSLLTLLLRKKKDLDIRYYQKSELIVFLPLSFCL